MIELTDTHCHIQSIGSFGGEETTRELWAKSSVISSAELIDNAKKQQVNRLIAVGCTLEDSLLAIELAKNQPNVWATIGIHPHEAKDYVNNQAKLDEFASLATKNKVVAVGECGLDYFYSHSNPNDQQQILKFQLDLAKKHNLAVIFHVRKAFDDFWPIIADYKNIRGVLHSFTDNQANLEKALKLGFYIGVNGIATFTKNDQQLAVYRSIPLENLLLETDSPFLTPTPLRGKINEPKNVRLVAEYLAGLRGETLETISAQTTLNAHKLFSL